MILSDLSVKRPVLASVFSLLLIAFGIVSYGKLPLREYPEIDPPIVSIQTDYPGAAANVVETRITKPIEDRIAGIEGIKSISSKSSDGRSEITIEFSISRDIDGATNDVRDRVSGALDNFPEEADPPEIQKVDANADVIMWFNLTSANMSVMELTDFARRYLSDRFSSLDGVARVRVGGGLDYSMRIWVDRNALAARGLTVADVEDALRAENVELPAGSVESLARDFTVRVERGYKDTEDFRQLVLKQGTDGYLVRLKDVARVEIGPQEHRTLFRGNTTPMVGIGIIKQSQANTLDVARAARAEAKRINPTLPEGMEIMATYDTSVFIKSAIDEVYNTLFIAIGLVVLIIYIFLGDFRAMLIPAVTVPISLIATFIVLLAFGYTINLLTLLALVLAIGLVVDDAIVVLENIYRRVELGEPRLLASYRGTRQVAFAVIATTLVLVAVFIPITFLEGDTGKLFSEFVIGLSAAVIFSSFVALSLTPMMCSKLLRRGGQRKSPLARRIDGFFDRLKDRYANGLKYTLANPLWIYVTFFAIAFSGVFLFNRVPHEFAPREDRGAFFINVTGPEGATFEYMKGHMDEIERRLMPMVESGEVERLLIRAPRSFGATGSFNGGVGIMVLAPWENRRPAGAIMAEVNKRLDDLTGVRAFPVMRQGIGGRVQKPVQFVLGGSSYEELAEWRDILMEKAGENPGLVGLDYDYKETKPQLRIQIDRDRAGDLGVSVVTISRTLESLLGSRRVTTFIDDGEEYDVIVEGEQDMQRSPLDMTHIYVRSERSGKLIPLANLITIEEYADASDLNRYNKMRAITFEANLAEGYRLGEALDYLEELVRQHLPAGARIDYKGESLDYTSSGGQIYLIFLLALAVVFLVLAGQFESYVHPFIIMLTVPLAIAGALLGLFLFGQSLNIYSQIGLIMLVGLAAKNGILIVEFANQLRDEGMDFDRAILEASGKRFRPILMTSLTTAMGAVPLILSSGAGAETRFVIGIVVFTGVIIATLFTLYSIPVAYQLFARHTKSPHATAERLEAQLKEYKKKV